MKRKAKIGAEILCLAAIALLLMVIFGFSAQEAEKSSSVSIKVTEEIASVSQSYEEMPPAEKKTVISYLHPIVRKMAHFSEYTLLGALLLTETLFRRWNMGTRAGAALGTGLLLAALDEWHQTFVKGRSGEVRDVLIDFSGILLGVLLLCLLRFLFLYFSQKNKRKREGKE